MDRCATLIKTLTNATYERLKIDIIPLTLGSDHRTAIVRVCYLDTKFSHAMLVEIIQLLSVVELTWKGASLPLYILWETEELLGGDLAFFNTSNLCNKREARKFIGDYAQLCVDAIYRNGTIGLRAPVVTIQVIGRTAFGGGLEAALSCWFAYARDKDVRLGFTEAKFGLFPFAGGRWFAPARAQTEEARMFANDMITFGTVHRAGELRTYRLIDGFAGPEKVIGWLTDMGLDEHEDRLNGECRRVSALRIPRKILVSEGRKWVGRVINLPDNHRRTIKVLAKHQSAKGTGVYKKPIQNVA